MQRLFTFLLILALPVCAEDSIPEVWWVFLNRGPSKAPLSNEDRQKYQAAHVGNFGTQYKAGKLIMAGPLGDNGFIRGIVALTVKTKAEALAVFKDDPLVQHDYLAVEIYPTRLDRSRIKPATEPFKLGQYALGIVKRGPQWQPLARAPKPDTLLQLVPTLKKLDESGDLAFVGAFLDSDQLVGVAMFRHGDLAKLKAALDGDESVKGGRVVFELHPQLLADGSLAK